MNFYMQSEGSPTAFTEFTVRDMICGAGLCSIQGSVLQHGVTGSRHRLCVHIYIYIYIYICTEEFCEGTTKMPRRGFVGYSERSVP